MPEVILQEPKEVLAPASRRFEIPVFGETSDPKADPALAPPAPPKAKAPAAEPAEAVPQDGQNTGEQATPATPEGEKPDTEKDDPEKQRGTRRFERRLDKAYRRAAEEKARADFLAKEVEKLRPQAPVDTNAPKLEQFTSVEDFSQAATKYGAEKAIKEYEEKQRSAANQQMQERIVNDWEEKEAKGEEKYEDFNKVVGKLDPRIPMNVAIMQAENGEDVAHYLGKHQKEAERIIRLDPVSQIREIGKLEAKLLAEPAKPKTPSKAPAPITPLTGAAPIASDLPSENDDTAAWIKKRQRQVHGKR